MQELNLSKKLTTCPQLVIDSLCRIPENSAELIILFFCQSRDTIFTRCSRRGCISFQAHLKNLRIPLKLCTKSYMTIVLIPNKEIGH